MTKRLPLSLLLFAAVLVAPMAAEAQRRSPLEDAPAIRKRVELRASRIELGASLGSTINQTFYHGVLANVRLGFHFTDWLSLSASGAFNVASLKTGFNEELFRTLRNEPNPDNPRDPTTGEALSPLNKIGYLLGVQAEVTPFAGKYAVFGALFASYDFYFFGGPGFLNLTAANGNPASPCPATGRADSETMAIGGSCLVSGTKIGATYGVGFHSFFNNVVALNVELRDILAKDNPAGRDVNGDTREDNADLSWSSHLMAFLGVTVYLPASATISD